MHIHVEDTEQYRQPKVNKYLTAQIVDSFLSAYWSIYELHKISIEILFSALCSFFFFILCVLHYLYLYTIFYIYIFISTLKLREQFLIPCYASCLKLSSM